MFPFLIFLSFLLFVLALTACLCSPHLEPQLVFSVQT